MANKPYIYITRKLPESVIAKLRSLAEVGMWDSEEVPVPREILLGEAKKADALLTMVTDKIDKEVFEIGANLKVVANCAVGYDNIDVEEATKRRIVVCNTPDVLTDTTADLAFSLILITSRRIIEAVDVVRTGGWKSWYPYFLAGTDVHHKTLGIVGMGNIGEAVAKRAIGFDMRVLYHNRNRKLEAEESLGVVYASFDELVKESDFVLVLTPLTPETKGMFTKEVFKKMKKSAYFINVARGPIAVEADLIEALKEGEIAGAGLDVYDKEPISRDHPLLQLDNVVALPHIGSASVETRTAMMKLACDNIEAVLKNEGPKTPVNKQFIQTT